jgi:hypothetical protein
VAIHTNPQSVVICEMKDKLSKMHVRRRLEQHAQRYLLLARFVALA